VPTLPGSRSRALLGSSRDRVWLPFIAAPFLVASLRQSTINNRQSAIQNSCPGFWLRSDPGETASASMVRVHGRESSSFRGVGRLPPQDVGHYFGSARKSSSGRCTSGIFAAASWRRPSRVCRSLRGPESRNWDNECRRACRSWALRVRNQLCATRLSLPEFRNSISSRTGSRRCAHVNTECFPASRVGPIPPITRVF
jgi:hypothetical protein